MKSIDKYVVVVPTHRIKHLRKNLKSILSQTVKPDLIIAIDDTDYLLNPEIKKEFDEINKNIPVKYYNKNDDTLSGTLQKNGAVRAFLNIFLCLEDTFQNNEENIFIHILEDDCYYIRKNTTEKFKNTHSKFQKNLYRLNLIENEEI
jgi:glycosyltransferase involved in cell wall biosynthesis